MPLLPIYSSAGFDPVVVRAETAGQCRIGEPPESGGQGNGRVPQMAGEHVVTGGGGVSGDDKSVGCGDEGEEVRESKYGAEYRDASGDIWEAR